MEFENNTEYLITGGNMKALRETVNSLRDTLNESRGESLHVAARALGTADFLMDKIQTIFGWVEDSAHKLWNTEDNFRMYVEQTLRTKYDWKNLKESGQYRIWYRFGKLWDTVDYRDHILLGSMTETEAIVRDVLEKLANEVDGEFEIDDKTDECWVEW